MQWDIDVSIVTDKTVSVVSITTVRGQDSACSRSSAGGQRVGSQIKRQEFRS